MTMIRKIFFPDAFIKEDCLTVIIFSGAVKRTKKRTEYKSCSRQGSSQTFLREVQIKLQNPGSIQ